MNRNYPFPKGSLVTWSKDAPDAWHWIWTPGPIKVISFRWNDGISSEYLKKFEEKFGGESNVPGWIILVEYDADSTNYYDPPLSLLLQTKTIQKEIHEKWLFLCDEN